MRKHLLFLLLFLFCGLSLFAGPLEKGFEALKVFNYFDAKEYFEKARKGHPAGAEYGLSTIFYRTDNPFSHVDSAYKYILFSETSFKTSDLKEREDLKKLGVTSASISDLKEKITVRAYELAKTKNTIEFFNAFLENFDHPTYKKLVIEQRNALAFEAAKKLNTAQGYTDFMAKYPEAKEIKDAKWLYDLTLFNTLTTPNTLNTYIAFVRQYPKSPYRMQAEDSVYVFSTRTETKEEYHAFIKNFPTNHNARKAWDMIYRLSTMGAEASDYNSFLTAYPDFPDKARVKADSALSRVRYFLIQQDGRSGFIDSSGAVRIPCTYEWAEDFSEGLAAVMLNEKGGYIGRSGTLVIPLSFDEVNSFHRGFAIAKKDGKFGLIHKTGKQILPFQYEDISYDENVSGEKIFRTLKEGIYRFYDTKGTLLAEGKVEKAGDFFSGRAYVVQGGKYGFINKKGTLVIPASYDWTENFHNGIARVKLNEKTGLIDTTGKLLLPCEYDIIDNFSEGLALAVKDKKCGFVNPRGELVIPMKYDYSPEISASNGFQNGLAKVELNKKRGLIDNTGKIIIPLEFDDIRNFSEDLCAAKKGKWGFIDKNKKPKINFQYEYAWGFSEGLARVKIKGKIGFVGPTGAVVVPTNNLDEATDMKAGRSFIVSEGKKGVIDSKGITIIPVDMDEITEIGKGMLKLEKNDKFAYYNLTLRKQVWAETGF